MKEEVRRAAANYNIRTCQEGIKVISQKVAHSFPSRFNNCSMHKHNLKDFYLPSDYIVNMEFGTLYLKVYLNGFGLES